MVFRLKPAHVTFARWFIRIRWIAVGMLIFATFITKNVFGVSVQDTQIYILSGLLLMTNVFHVVMINRIVKSAGIHVVKLVKRELHVQITLDLFILTCILHFSGGIENPLIIFFFIHMVIASSIFSKFKTYIHTVSAIILLVALGWSEYKEIIPHYPLDGFIEHSFYQNKEIILGAGSFFIFTAILIVRLTQMVISRALKVEDAYVQTNIQLVKKDVLQSKYVLRVTHNIKGHLAAIMSNLRVVQANMVGDLNTKQQELVDRSYNRSELLENFVTELLSLHRKRLKQEPEFEEVSLVDITSKLISMTNTLAKEKGQIFTYHIDKTIPSFNGNPLTLNELFGNLLTNAVKYTPSGGDIRMTITNIDKYILSEISDTGVGIPEDEITKVFNEFYRASNVEKGVKSGSGLGLSIVKQIVENHNGKMQVESQVGKGTKFLITLPKK